MNRVMRIAAGVVRASVALAIVGIIALPVVWTLTTPAMAIALA